MGAEQEIIFNACPFTDAVFLYHPAGQIPIRGEN